MIHDIEQGTDAWLRLRLGKATASRMADICAKTKSGYSASRATYAAELVVERLTKTPREGFTNAAMQWGTTTEPEARRAYAFVTDTDVVEVGFVDHPTIPMSGASPDGLAGDDGMVEIKCPQTSTHIATLLGKTFADKYVKQALWQLACTGRQWCDLASYDPRLPESMRLFIQRVERDDEAIAELEAEVSKFLSEVDKTISDLREQYEPKLEEAA